MLFFVTFLKFCRQMPSISHGRFLLEFIIHWYQIFEAVQSELPTSVLGYNSISRDEGQSIPVSMYTGERQLERVASKYISSWSVSLIPLILAQQSGAIHLDATIGLIIIVLVVMAQVA
jgi:hypothetical protein